MEFQTPETLFPGMTRTIAMQYSKTHIKMCLLPVGLYSERNVPIAKGSYYESRKEDYFRILDIAVAKFYMKMI